MGYLKIDVATGGRWKEINMRMECLKNHQNNRPVKNAEDHEASSISAATNENRMDEDHQEKNRMDLQLYLAATNSDVNTLLDVLERVFNEKKLPLSAIFNQKSPGGNTLLHLSVIHRKPDNVALIAYHCPPTTIMQNSQGDTALHLAARAGSEIVDILLGFMDDDLFILSPSALVGVSKGFEDWFGSLRVRNAKGNLPLHEALIHHRTQAVNELFLKDTHVLYYQNNDGESPLYLAVAAGYTTVVETILQRSDDTDERLEGKSAVHAAISERNKGVLEVLLKHEPRFVHLRDEEGKTPFHLAASLGYLEEVKYLLSIHSAGIFTRDNNGLLPIHSASIKGHVNITQLLLQYWPDASELLSLNGQNILHIAAKSSRHNMVSYILRTPDFRKLVNMGGIRMEIHPCI